MKWKHIGIYESLRAKFDGSNTLNKDQYAYLYDQHGEKNFAIIYRFDSIYNLTPIHIKKSEINSEKDQKIALVLSYQTTDSNNFQRYKVLDWDGLAAALDLD